MYKACKRQIKIGLLYYYAEIGKQHLSKGGGPKGLGGSSPSGRVFRFVEQDEKLSS